MVRILKKNFTTKYIYPGFIYLQKQNNEQQLILPFATLHHDTALSNWPKFIPSDDQHKILGPRVFCRDIPRHIDNVNTIVNIGINKYLSRGEFRGEMSRWPIVAGARAQTGSFIQQIELNGRDITFVSIDEAINNAFH